MAKDLAGLANSNTQTEQFIRMRVTPDRECFSNGASAAKESKFEQPELDVCCETAVGAYFGRKLQLLFPLPPENSEPEHVRAILQRIDAGQESACPSEEKQE
ncbi:MAG: hypothetical protein L0Y57_05150 [Beijerinckiaceae bacterium]|nr:hypothetical protein [Beijerinckiaceae bacterium]